MTTANTRASWRHLGKKQCQLFPMFFSSTSEERKPSGSS